MREKGGGERGGGVCMRGDTSGVGGARGRERDATTHAHTENTG